MKKHSALLTALITAAATLLSSASFLPASEAIAADPVKIMPIGDSITFGMGEDGGYRKYLDYALKQKGISFDMVGPEGSNSATFTYNGQSCQYDNNHAGYSGYQIKEVPDWGKQQGGQGSLYNKLTERNAVGNAKPDIILLIIGTNDMTGNRNLSSCESELHDLVDYFLENMADDGIVFMGSIPEFTAYGGNAQRVGNYNSTVQKVAESYGDNVQFADVHGCLNGMNDIGSDSLHPNGKGYEKMGLFWADVIEEYLSGSTAEPYDPSDPLLLHSDFENGISGWKGRGNATVSVSKNAAAEGAASAFVTDRSASWNGISYTINSNHCPAGQHISVDAQVMQKSGSTVHFKMTMQYDGNNGTTYDTFAEVDASSGKWVTISVPDYVLQDGTSPSLYIETDTETCDFFLDDVTVLKTDGSYVPQKTYKSGDVDHNGSVDDSDAQLLRDFLLSKGGDIYSDTSDLDENDVLDARDLTLLKKLLLSDESSSAADPSEYMSKIRSQITVNVPSSALATAGGTLEHITYFSKKANHDKGANVWLPPSYDKNKKYPVFYVNHGYGGDESAMVNGMGVREIATNLIKSGEAEPMIIVFTNQYTNPARTTETGNGSEDVPYYDAFAEDLPDSLMPYIESHYPVKTGRENTAVAGFSMGGRESLYIGMMCKDKIGYIGAGAPAPGIFPTQDQFMNHPGCMSKDDIRIDAPYSPYVLMIAGGTNDSMVGTYPKQYADLFTEHGTENIYISVPGGGHDSNTVIPLMYNFIRCLFKA